MSCLIWVQAVSNGYQQTISSKELKKLLRENSDCLLFSRVFCELQGPYIHGGSSQSLEQCVKKNIGKQTDSLKLSDSRIHKQGNKTVTQSEADSVSTDNVVSWTPDHLNMTNNDNSGASIVTGSSSDLGSARLTPSDSRGESIVDKDNSYIPGVFKESKDGSVVHITEREELLSGMYIKRIYHECEGRIEKSVPRIVIWHHELPEVPEYAKIQFHMMMSFNITMTSLDDHVLEFQYNQCMKPSCDTLGKIAWVR